MKSPNQIYVQALPGVGGPAGRWQVSTGYGYDVRWRGNEIYYGTQDNKMMSVTVQTTAQRVRAESPRQLFTPDFQRASLRGFDVSSDGQRFLIIVNKQQAETDRLTVVSKWQAAVRK